MNGLQLKELLDSVCDKCRKETALSILFKLESALAYYDNDDMFTKESIFSYLLDIVKEIGVCL